MYVFIKKNKIEFVPCVCRRDKESSKRKQMAGDNLLIVCIWGFHLFLEGKESTQQCQ